MSVLALVASGALACAGCAAQSEEPVIDQEPGTASAEPGRAQDEAAAATPGAPAEQALAGGENTGQAQERWFGGWGGFGGWGFPGLWGGWGGWGGFGGCGWGGCW
jgi:hypothetical protein